MNCLLFEDDHLLVLNKPAGLNTHSPSPYAGEGLYEWLRHRDPRWSNLAIIHRLDKETSGVIVFGKSAAANRSLTAQFTEHSVQKIYRLLAAQPPAQNDFTIESVISRTGDRYQSLPPGSAGEPAVTRFRVLGRDADGRCLLEALPLTGRTHQIRAQAAAGGFPVVGDGLYGGPPGPRVCLHARQITFRHPVSDKAVTFTAPEDFSAASRITLRTALIDGRQTTAYRLIHGAADGWPDWFVDRIGDFLLSQSEQAPDIGQERDLRRLMELCGARGVYHKTLMRDNRRVSVAESSPKLLLGEAATGAFAVRENGVAFEQSFAEGGSTGLFLDQRDNRRRLLINHVAAGFTVFPEHASGAEVLNVFSYTCGFSVCAAMAGARATSLDLSKKYLEWGRRNFVLNGLDPARHDFIFGDAFEWLRRLAKKGRAFDLVILDPPTFSQSKQHGAFRAEHDYGDLVAAALPLVKSGGVLFASTNAARLEPEEFLTVIGTAVKSIRREISVRHYAPQPPGFPIHRGQPAHLKTAWLRIS